MKRILLITVLIVALGVFCVTLARATLIAPSEPNVAPSREAFQDASSTPDQLPARLRIPALGIDAKVQQVGVNAKGNMGVPNNYTDVGWHRNGTVPGRVGSAVIDGHVDNGLSLAGVFKHLDQVAVGSDIYVDTVGGQTLHFIVERTASYGYKDVPTDALFNAHDQARLNLITCAGSWVKGDRTYDERLVVYAVLSP